MITEVEIKALKCFLKLNTHLSEVVVCSYWSNDKIWEVTGTLKGINNFSSIKIDNQVLRFIGNSSVIRSITLQSSGEVLFSNPYVIDCYNKKDINLITEKVFGRLMQIDSLKSYDYQRYKLLKDSFLFIKNDLLEEWVKVVNHLLDNNKKFVLSMILEYLKRLANGESLDRILIRLNSTNLDNKYKVLIRKCLNKYCISSDIKLSLKKVD